MVTGNRPSLGRLRGKPRGVQLPPGPLLLDPHHVLEDALDRHKPPSLNELTEHRTGQIGSSRKRGQRRRDELRLLERDPVAFVDEA